MKRIIIFLFCIALKTMGNAQAPGIKEVGLDVPLVYNCTPVKDQSMSGTCWSFTSLSFIESEVMQNQKRQLDLSEMFIARYSYIRKIETYLRKKGSIYFTPGGQFHDVLWVLKNYGAIPENKYSGKVSGELWHNHAQLDTAIDQYVKQLLNKKIVTLTKTAYHYIDSVLDTHLGKVPEQFDFEGKVYTPKTFLAEVVNLKLDDYVEITSYTHHPFYTKFVLEDKYNWTGDAYYNVPIRDLFSITNQTLKNGHTIGWDGDVDEPGFLYEKGMAYLPTKVKGYQEERQRTFKDSTTDIDHLMHIVALTKDKFGRDWYYVKNSWGNYTNKLKGFLFMSKDYFAIKTSAIIVNKNNIPTGVRKKLKL